MKKRAFVLALALVTVLSLMPTAALAASFTVEEVVPVGTYFAIDYVSDGLACVIAETTDDAGRRDYKYGYIDTTGKVVIPCIYDTAEPFTHGLARVWMGKGDPGDERLVGVIDKAGNEVVPIGKYYEAMLLSANLIAVSIPTEERTPSNRFPDGKWGVIDITGKEIIPFKYDIIYPSSEGFFIAGIKKEGVEEYMGHDPAGYSAYDYGVVDFTGKAVTPFKYSEIWEFYDGYAPVRVGGSNLVIGDHGKWGIIDTTGKEILPCKYDETQYFSDGLALVKQNERYCYVNTAGKVVLPFQYFLAHPFSEGLAAVDSTDGRGYIDTTGKIVLPFQYMTQHLFEDRFFSEGLVAVGASSRSPRRSWDWGFMDNTGKEVVPPQYYTVGDFHEGFAAVKDSNEKWGFIDTTGKEIVPCQYDEVEDDVFVLDAQYNFVPVRQYGDYSSNSEWGLLGFFNNATTAFTSTQEVDVDGEKVTFQCYALKDDNGNLTNYIKVRDLAAILNGTAAQFEVGYYSNTIHLVKGWAYTPNGSEGSTPFSGHRAYAKSAAQTDVDGTSLALDAITLTDDNGGGYTYYKLRDLGQALGFNVGWSDEKGVFLETDKPYSADN